MLMKHPLSGNILVVRNGPNIPNCVTEMVTILSVAQVPPISLVHVGHRVFFYVIRNGRCLSALLAAGVIGSAHGCFVALVDVLATRNAFGACCVTKSDI